MTVKDTMKAIKAIGCSVRRTDEREYRINVPNGTEESAYYTTDSDDALKTAWAMIKAFESKIAMDTRPRIGGLHFGDTVSFFTKGEERKVTGQVTRVVHGEYPNPPHSRVVNQAG
jgi:hypothetical protein